MEESRVHFTSTKNTLTIVVDGEVYITDKSHVFWRELQELVRDPDVDPEYLIGLLNPLDVTLATLKMERFDDA